MGIYYGVRAVMRLGERTGNSKDFPKQPYIQEDEALIGILGPARSFVAADLTSRREYKRCQNSYPEGVLLFKIKKSDLKYCSDEGKVDVEEIAKTVRLYAELLESSIQWYEVAEESDF